MLGMSASARSKRVESIQLAVVVWILIMLLFVKAGYSEEPVIVEFLYYGCAPCDPEKYENYEHNNQVITNLLEDYGSKVLVERIPFFSPEGREKIDQYGLELDDWNAIVVSYERTFTGSVNETRVRELIDAYLTDSIHDIAVVDVTPFNSTIEVDQSVNISVTIENRGVEVESFTVNAYCNESLIGFQTITYLNPKGRISVFFTWDTTNQTVGHYVVKVEAEAVLGETILANNLYVYESIEIANPSTSNLAAMALLAFSFGFFETFSPCLIVLLSFVLSYTLGKTSGFRENFAKVMVFGLGFLSATLILALAFGLVFLSLPALQRSLMWIVTILAIVMGLNLTGILRMPSRMSIESKPLIKKLTGKYVFTYTGLFLLGFVFYFLDPCIAPIFVSMMPLLLPEFLLFTLSIFCLGAIIPFICIGFFAGSISKLVRTTYRHRTKVRAISGLILICYATYLIVFYLLQ